MGVDLNKTKHNIIMVIRYACVAWFIKQIVFIIAKNNFIIQFNLIMELTLAPTFQTNERKI